MFYYTYGRVEITWNNGESILKQNLDSKNMKFVLDSLMINGDYKRAIKIIL